MEGNSRVLQTLTGQETDSSSPNGFFKVAWKLKMEIPAIRICV